MSETVYHHAARGVHPASFVQPTAPDTTALQDGTEWTDTSAGPPYVRKVWRTATSTWDVVQMDATGYPLPGGGRLESDTGIFRLADTFTRPDQGTWGTASDGHPWHRFVAGLIDSNPSDPPGALVVQGNEGILRFITGANVLGPILGPPLAGADCELLVRWQATVTDPGDDLRTIQLGMLARLSDYDHGVLFLMAGWTATGGTPDPVVQVLDTDFPGVPQSPQNVAPIVGGQRYWTRWRMTGQTHSWRTWLDGAGEPSAWDGSWTDTSWPETGMSGTSVGLYLYPRGNISLVAEVDHFSATTIPAQGRIRVRGADGAVQWDHDGTTMRQYSGTTEVLQTPLPVLGTTPETIVGIDPATGLPSSAPKQNPVIETVLLQQATEQPAPPSTTCTQIQCGAATALRDHLNDWFLNVRGILNAALNTLGTALGSLLVDTGTAFFVALTDGADIELAPEVYNLLKLVLKAVPGITGAALQAGFAILSTTQLEWLRTKVYCHITCSANQIILTQDQMFAWHDDIAADTTILSGIQRDVCAAIVAWGANWSLSAWAQQAQTGAGLPSHDCDAYACP